MTEEQLRADFERLANKNTQLGLRRSRRGSYMNPSIARDWKWFQMGYTAATVATGSAPAAAEPGKGEGTRVGKLERSGYFAAGGDES